MSDQRLHELAVYHFMVGYYKMQIGKQKKRITYEPDKLYKSHLREELITIL
ncbi:Uncharacterised protein [Sphingobacterium multivorum]|nr:Uncharacterised protein [Sphingobacterium multivorum]